MVVKYKCFHCGKKIAYETMGKRVRCQYCGGKILYKQRSIGTKVKAR